MNLKNDSIHIKRFYNALKLHFTGKNNDHPSLNKLINQLQNQNTENYDELPTFNVLIEKHLSKTLPKYISKIRLNDNNVELQFRKKELVLQSQLNNLKSFIIKNEIFSEHKEISSLRKELLSINIGNELLFHSYNDEKLIVFAELLHNDSLFYFHRNSYYNKLIKVYSSFDDEAILNKLRPIDLEKLLNRLFFAKKNLGKELSMKIDLNKCVYKFLNDLKNSDMKLTNSELFRLIDFTFNDENITNIQLIYDEFLKSKNCEKNIEFFNGFLSIFIPLSYSNERLKSVEFLGQIFNDIITNEIKPNRLLLKFFLKFSISIQNEAMTSETVRFIIKNFYLDNETFNFIFFAIIKTNNYKLINSLFEIHLFQFKNLIKKSNLNLDSIAISNMKNDKYRISIRLLDHLIEKDTTLTDSKKLNNVSNGFLFQLGFNPIPGKLFKDYLATEFKNNDELEKGFLINTNSYEKLLNQYNNNIEKLKVTDNRGKQNNEIKENRNNRKTTDKSVVKKSLMSLDEKFESGPFGAESVSIEEKLRSKLRS